MALRKMVIPFKNFLKNTVISSTQMNDDLAEVEYVFNELFDAFDERTKDTYSKEEVNNLQTESDKDLEKSITNAYNAMEELINSEVGDIILDGVLDASTDIYITDEQVSKILEGAILEKNCFDFGTFLEQNESYKLNGGEF